MGTLPVDYPLEFSSFNNDIFMMGVNDNNNYHFKAGRYDGDKWKFTSETISSIKRRSTGKNMLIWSNASNGKYSKNFNPNTRSWGTTQTPPSIPLTDTHYIMQKGYFEEYFFWLRRNHGGHSILTSTDYNNKPTQYAKPSGTNFIADRRNGKAHLFIIKNDQMVSKALTGTTDKIEANDYEFGIAGASSFVTYSGSSYATANKLNLHKVIDTSAEGYYVDYPVTQVRIKHGYGYEYTSFDYATSNARIESNGTARYNETHVIPGSAVAHLRPYGATHHYFFDGSNYNSSYGQIYFNRLAGQRYRTENRNSAGAVVSYFQTDFNELHSNGVVRINTPSTSVLKDGISTATYYTYNTTNQMTSSYFYSRDANNQNDLHRTYYTYFWEKYGAQQGIYNTVIQQRKTVNNVNLSANATKWKQWNGKWAPEKEYTWNGGTLDFPNWTSTSNPSGWILTSTITNRDIYGNVNETLDMDGNYTAVAHGYDKTLPAMTVYRARYNQLWFDDFNGGGNIQSWLFSGTSTTSGDLYLPSSGVRYAMMYDDISHGNFKADFKVRLTNLGSGYASFVFNSPTNAPGASSGNHLRFYANGNISLYYGSSLRTTYSYSGDLTDWHTVSVDRTSSQIEIYLNGEKIITTSASSAQSSTFHGFYANNRGAYFDHFRYYPNAGYASSSSLDKSTKLPVEAMDERGLLSTTAYDPWGSPVAAADAQGLPVSTTTGAPSTKYNQAFNGNDPSRSLSTVIQANVGFLDDFRYKRTK
ncbi:MAG: hypothetical protein KI790_02585 [Cyclobacteriaceae bacterium]|nr:hypothetical protein [Cyclobacteriaceae bacterium HetDA_MAG_MS6]